MHTNHGRFFVSTHACSKALEGSHVGYLKQRHGGCDRCQVRCGGRAAGTTQNDGGEWAETCAPILRASGWTLGAQVHVCCIVVDFFFASCVDTDVLEYRVNQKQQPWRCNNGYLDQHSFLRLRQLRPDTDHSTFLSSSSGVLGSHCNADCTVLSTKRPIECSDGNLIYLRSVNQ